MSIEALTEPTPSTTAVELVDGIKECAWLIDSLFAALAHMNVEGTEKARQGICHLGQELIRQADLKLDALHALKKTAGVN